MAIGDDHGWTTEAHHAALVVDVLQWANYQRAGAKGSRPKPVPRPAAIKEAADSARRKEIQTLEAARRMHARRTPHN